MWGRMNCDICKKELDTNEECMAAINQETQETVLICIGCLEKMQEKVP